MASINKVIVLGNLGRNPEARYTSTGDCICTLSLATSDKWTDKASGERREATEWHRVVLYRKLGETAAQFLRKGELVYIEGHLHTRKWTDKDGNDRYTTEIVADQMQMMGGGHQYDFHQGDAGVHDGAQDPIAYAADGEAGDADGARDAPAGAGGAHRGAHTPASRSGYDRQRARRRDTEALDQYTDEIPF